MAVVAAQQADFSGLAADKLIEAMTDRLQRLGDVPFNEVATERGDGTLPARVEVVEPIGSQLLVTSTTGGQALKLLTPTDFQVGPGDELWLRPDLERAGWFDPGSGARLDRGGSGRPGQGEQEGRPGPGEPVA